MYTNKQLDNNTQQPAISIQHEMIIRKEDLPVGELYHGRVQRSTEHKVNIVFFPGYFSINHNALSGARFRNFVFASRIWE